MSESDRQVVPFPQLPDGGHLDVDAGAGVEVRDRLYETEEGLDELVDWQGLARGESAAFR